MDTEQVSGSRKSRKLRPLFSTDFFKSSHKLRTPSPQPPIIQSRSESLVHAVLPTPPEEGPLIPPKGASFAHSKQKTQALPAIITKELRKSSFSSRKSPRAKLLPPMSPDEERIVTVSEDLNVVVTLTPPPPGLSRSNSLTKQKSCPVSKY